MLDRCYRPGNVGFVHYGGRGIVVCDRWRASFSAFLADMGRRPGPLHSLDRVNVNGDYEPSNCRWADLRTQHNNRRDNVFVDYDGERMTVAMAADRSGLPAGLLYQRLRRGFSVDRLFEPMRPYRRSGPA